MLLPRLSRRHDQRLPSQRATSPAHDQAHEQEGPGDDQDRHRPLPARVAGGLPPQAQGLADPERAGVCQLDDASELVSRRFTDLARRPRPSSPAGRAERLDRDRRSARGTPPGSEFRAWASSRPSQSIRPRSLRDPHREVVPATFLSGSFFVRAASEALLTSLSRTRRTISGDAPKRTA